MKYIKAVKGEEAIVLYSPFYGILALVRESMRKALEWDINDLPGIRYYEDLQMYGFAIDNDLRADIVLKAQNIEVKYTMFDREEIPNCIAIA